MNATPIALMTAVLLLVAAGSSAAQTVPVTDDQAVQQFQQAAHDYALMHRNLERRFPPIEVTADVAGLHQAFEAMAAAVRMARPEAQPGDLFSPAVGEVLRDRIARSLDRQGLTAFDVRVAELADTGHAGPVALKVNGSFPWAIATGMIPCILQALPPLPPELEYRMVGTDLILIDVPAGLIVDILPYALARCEDIRVKDGGL